MENENNKLLEDLTVYIDFYKRLSFSIMRFIKIGTNNIINIDSYIFSSMQGTIESIESLIKKERINDAYALLRKYYDSTIINIYISIYLQDNSSVDNFIIKKIDNWVKGNEPLPEYRIMNNYVRNSPKTKIITDLIFNDDTYKKLRDRCNDHTHYNFFHNLLMNDNQLYLKNRLEIINEFSTDIRNIFILHFSYLFHLNDHYMVSSDYIDAFDCGIIPEEEMQYYVAPFIQDTFNQIIKTHRPDISKEILENTGMNLT